MSIKQKRDMVLIFIIVIALNAMFLVVTSCSSGVDVSEEDKVLTSFNAIWPNDFTYVCIFSPPVIT